MKTAICHYSFHRRFSEEKWSLKRLVREVESLGVDGIDFHARMLPPPNEAIDAIRDALNGSRLFFAGLSLSTHFTRDNAADFKKEIETTARWIVAAGKARAPVSRVFGGGSDRHDQPTIHAGMQQILQALKELVPAAEQAGVVLALENHGGLPGTGEEQVQLIEAIHSLNLRATVDVGNYMMCGQSSVEGTRIAAPYCAYVHLKDFRRFSDSKEARGFRLEPVVVGKGDVDHNQCLEILQKAGYKGTVALEYEGTEPETTGVPESVAFMRRLLSANGG